MAEQSCQRVASERGRKTTLTNNKRGCRIYQCIFIRRENKTSTKFGRVVAGSYLEPRQPPIPLLLVIKQSERQGFARVLIA